MFDVLSLAFVAQSVLPQVHPGRLVEAYRTDAPSLVRCVNDTPATFLLAHRGSWTDTDRPQNSLSALKDAAELPVFIEFDVRNTRDNQVIVLHDEVLDRETTGTGPVSMHSASEITALQLRNSQGQPVDEHPALLVKVLEQIGDTALLMLDLKGGDIGPTLDLLEQYGALKSAAYVAYDLDQLRQVFQRHGASIVFYRIDSLAEFRAVTEIAPDLVQVVQLSNTLGLDRETTEAILNSDIGLSSGVGAIESGANDFLTLTSEDYAELADGYFAWLLSDRISHTAPILYGQEFELAKHLNVCIDIIL